VGYLLPKVSINLLQEWIWYSALPNTVLANDGAAEQIEFHGAHSGAGSRSTKCDQFLF
jgi:hypothetical protein